MYGKKCTENQKGLVCNASILNFASFSHHHAYSDLHKNYFNLREIHESRTLRQIMTTGSVLGDIQLLAVEGTSENGMNYAVFEDLKVKLDPLVVVSNNDVMKICKYKQLEKMSKFELSQFTHVISNTTDFPNYDTITDELMIPVVTTQWVKDVIKNKRVVPLRSYSPNPEHFFKDVIIAAGGGIQVDDKEILKVAVKTFGGIYLDELKKSLTHFVTNDLEDDNTKLIMAFNEYNPSGKTVKIVKVDWIFDSIRSGRVLADSSYSLDSIDNNKGENVKAASREWPEYVSKLDFKLSDNLKISNAVRSHFNTLGNGKQNQESIYLTRYINTDLDVACEQRTFDYFFSLLFHKSDTLPFDSLLYHPVNTKPVAGMSETLIATTNYTGDSRIYIEELVLRMGGKFSKTMKSANTHLVASKSVGKKFEFANTWNVKIVNHMWVEDSFVNWELMDVVNYKRLPRDTKGVRFIGDVQFSGFSYERKITKKEEEKTANAGTETEKALPSKNSDQSNVKVVTASNDIIQNKPKDGGSSTVEVQINNKKEIDEIEKKEEKDDKVIENSLKPVEMKGSASKTEGGVRTRTRREIKPREEPEKKTDEVEKAGKAKILDNSEKVAEEHDESKKSDAVWKIPDEVDSVSKTKSNKRKASVAVEDNKEDTDGVKKVAKKSVKSDKPYNITAIVTGFDGTLSAGDKRELKKVGITIVENANKNINCIIAPSLLRTQKFLTALSYSPEHLLEPLFLSDVLGTLDSVRKIGDFASISPKVEKYDIWEHVDFDKDIQPKRLFRKNTTREEAIEYMKKSRHGLFDGFVFNLSPGLAGGFDTLKSILKSFGCKQCVLFKENTKAASVSPESVNGVSGVAILVCTPTEKKVQKHFSDVCKSNEKKYVVLEWDAIVTAIFEAALDLKSAKVLQQNGVL